MNLPMTSLRGRLAALAALAGAVLCIGAAPASATNWQPGQSSLVYTPHVTMNITDDETWYPVTQTHGLGYHVLGAVGFAPKYFHRKFARCTGGEVRAELEIIGWTENDTAINTWSRMNLYEGTSCNTQDLDGQSQWRVLQIAPGKSVNTSISVKNENEGGDSAIAVFSIVAQPIQ